MKKILRTAFMVAVLAVMATGTAQAATVVTTETALKSAISSGASEIEFGAHITLSSLSGISISNQTLTIDLQGYSLNGKAGVDGTDGADTSTNGKDGTAGTTGGNVFTLSNVNLTLKNGFVQAGNGGDGGDGGEGGSSSSYYPGDGDNGADGGDCITITSKSTITLDAVTLSGGAGGSPGAGGKLYYTIYGITLWRSGAFGTPGAGGTAIQGPMNLTAKNSSTIIAGSVSNNVTNNTAGGGGTKANTAGFAIYAESGSDISISGSTVTGYYTTVIWSENSSLYMYDSRVTSGSEFIMYTTLIESLPIGYTTDHSGEAIKMVGSANTLYLDDVYIKNGRYDGDYVSMASGIYLENTTAEINNVTIYGVKHALEASKSTVEITNGKLYVDVDTHILYYQRQL